MNRDAARVGAAGAGTEGRLLGLAGSRVLLPDGPLRAATVWVDVAGGTIVSVSRAGDRGSDATPGRVVALGDHVLAPGYVDVHVHGGAGRQVNAARADDVEAAVGEIAAFHARHGTTSLVATTVSDRPERLCASVEGVARAARRGPGLDPAPRMAGHPAIEGAAPGSRVLGCHLEGPFISPARAGAQDPDQVRRPDPAELARLLELGGGTVRMVTLAPELDGADALIAECVDAGVVVSLGHSDAGYGCASAAFDAGASHVTHLFDAMAPLHHRAPGLVGAALSDGRATVEIICDLHHVHPAIVGIVAAAAGDRMVLVTDATAAAGMPPGPLALGRLDAVLSGTKVTLASDPGTLAGSALTMDAAVRHAVREARVPLEEALRAASDIPARALLRCSPVPTTLTGLSGLGTIAPGAPADLVVLDDELETVATVVAGRAVFDPTDLLG